MRIQRWHSPLWSFIISSRRASALDKKNVDGGDADVDGRWRHHWCFFARFRRFFFAVARVFARTFDLAPSDAIGPSSAVQLKTALNTHTHKDSIKRKNPTNFTGFYRFFGNELGSNRRWSRCQLERRNPTKKWRNEWIGNSSSVKEKESVVLFLFRVFFFFGLPLSFGGRPFAGGAPVNGRNFHRKR